MSNSGLSDLATGIPPLNATFIAKQNVATACSVIDIWNRCIAIYPGKMVPELTITKPYSA